MPMTTRSVFMLSALAGTVAAILVEARRRGKRAEAIRDKVDGQDWESAPIKPVVRGAKIPAPEQVAREVTGNDLGSH